MTAGRTPLAGRRRLPWSRLVPVLAVVVLCIGLAVALVIRTQADARIAAAERSAAPPVASPSASSPARSTMMLFGDASYIPAGGDLAWPGLVASALDVRLGGSSSVDYSWTTPAGQPFRESLSRIPPGTAAVVFAIGERDQQVSAEQISLSAAEILARLHSAAPGSRLVVIAPFAPSGAPSTSLLAVRNGLQSAARAQHAQFVDPIASDWLVGCSDCVSGGYFTTEGQIRVAQLVADALRDRIGPTS